MSDLMTLQEIHAIVLANRAPLGAITLESKDALGYVLAEAVTSRESLPRFANSAMDGYAFRSQDGHEDGVSLEVVGSTMAGDERAGTIGLNQAVRIMTGAPLPEGADAVCMQEEAVEQDGRVIIPRALSLGTNIRLPGEDIREGMEVFPEATMLGPVHLGVLAGIGVKTVSVYRRPVVGVLSTGDELVDEDGYLGPGKIRDTNRPALLAMVFANGARPLDLGIVGDDDNALAGAVEDATHRCDMLITSGGASYGDRDAIASALSMVKGARNIHSIRAAIRPAKPLVFGELGTSRMPVFALPGNPVSALVAFELFVKPALRILAGHREHIERPIGAIAESDFPRSPDGKVHYVRGHAWIDTAGELRVAASKGQGAHMLLALAHSNALVILENGNGTDAGERVELQLLTQGIAYAPMERSPVR